MRILHLSLTNFRNYTRLELDLPEGVMLLQGSNAQGKTNLLEAIYCLSRTRSRRTSTDRELVNWLTLEDELPFARLVARIEKGGGVDQIELSLVQSINQNRHRNTPGMRKHIRLNGASKRAVDVIGQLNAVLFLPEDIELAAGPPSLRRRYLDDIIGQVDRKYRRELQRYSHVVTQRNSLLKSLRRRGGDPPQLLFWDERLVEHGAYLLLRRQQVIGKMNEYMTGIHPKLTGEAERLRIEYRASICPEDGSIATHQTTLLPQQGVPSATEPSVPEERIGAAFSAELHRVRRRELEQGVSTIGPHRDDFRFVVDGVDMNTYGSRGQQRTGVLSLKLAEVELMRQERQDEPVLLLDDAVSELDATRRSCLLDTIAGAQQVIVTTTDLMPYGEDFCARVSRWQVCAGRLKELTFEPEVAS